MQREERRAEPDPTRRDRRFVTRISNPTFKDSGEQTYYCVMGIFWVLVAVAIALLVQGLMNSGDMLARSIAKDIGIGFVAVILYSYGKALKVYNKVETPATLADCFERQRNVWLLISFAVVSAVTFWVLSII